MHIRRRISLTSVAVASLFCACDRLVPSNSEHVDAPIVGPNSCNEGTPEIAACANDGDCTTYVDGCYCGAQPMNGVNVTHASAVSACERTAAENCALGCANFPGFVAEDGQMVDSSAMISVHCEPATKLCKTYVP